MATKLTKARHSRACSAHCSYLDIYISQKIRLCEDDFEDKFQFNLQAKSITFLDWKFSSIILIFLLFFAEFVKSTAFYTLLLLFQRVDMFELRFDAKITIQICLWYSSNSVKSSGFKKFCKKI